MCLKSCSRDGRDTRGKVIKTRGYENVSDLLRIYLNKNNMNEAKTKPSRGLKIS
jgi:hypothetical protein